MTMSMTGFGRGQYSGEDYYAKVDLRSLNHRYLDIFVKIPKNYLEYENIVRNAIKKNLNRGKVEVYIELKAVSAQSSNVELNLNLAKNYFEAANKLSLEFSLGKISLDELINMPGVINQLEETSDEKAEYALKKALDMAIENLNKMREKEGQYLKKYLLEILQDIEEIANYLKEMAPVVLSENEEKFYKKFDILKDELDINRLTTEIAIMYDKKDIEEEITRIFSHIEQFEKTLLNNESGKKLDFILQELNREANTISSKTSNIEILNAGVKLKSQIEKLREQVQNIE